MVYLKSYVAVPSRCMMPKYNTPQHNAEGLTVNIKQRYNTSQRNVKGLVLMVSYYRKYLFLNLETVTTNL